MRSTTQSLAIAAGVLLLPAAAATPVLAQAGRDTPMPGMTHMHQPMTDGTNMDGSDMDGSDMDRMPGQMTTADHAGMTRMHSRMMTEEPGSQPQPETTP